VDDNQPAPWRPEVDPIAIAALGKLLEELGEAAAIVARCLIQGIGEAEPVTGKANADALEEELADVAAAAEIAILHFGLRPRRIRERIDRKVQHLRGWHRLLELEEGGS
jgi:NTP pyrophosphatase (non-canonical NTP hydrolase)